LVQYVVRKRDIVMTVAGESFIVLKQPLRPSLPSSMVAAE
jgi:hypothetical protein